MHAAGDAARTDRRRAPTGALLLLPWALLLGALQAGGATAQRISGYALDIASVTARSPLTDGGVGDFLRLRLMSAPRLGPVRLDAAYEQTLSWSARGGTPGLLTPGVESAGTDWLSLQGTLAEDSRTRWRQRVDRLSAAVSLGPEAALTVGRQAISWATTLLLTPADPFAPFDPSDPFREYRPGVDAARLQLFPGPFSEIDAVVRPARTPLGTTLTALARGRTTVASWELSAWGGVLQDRAAAAAGAAGAVGGWAVRAEAALRSAAGVAGRSGGAVLRGTLGADRRFSVADRDLYLIAEIQHDGFGAANAGSLWSVLSSAPYRRGELQVLGRDVAAVQASWQAHPLVSLEMLALADLRDGSVLAAPAAAVSLSNEASLRAGAFLGVGNGTANLLAGRLGSEFGIVPSSGYLAISMFF